MLNVVQGTTGHTVTLAACLVAHCLRRLRYAAFGALVGATCACVAAWLIPVCPTRIAVTNMSCTIQSTGGHTVTLVVRPMAHYLRQFTGALVVTDDSVVCAFAYLLYLLSSLIFLLITLQCYCTIWFCSGSTCVINVFRCSYYLCLVH